MVRLGRKKFFHSYAPRFRGHRPTSISIAGHPFLVESWREVLLTTCQFILSRKPSEFSRILELKGSKRLWFSRKVKELQSPIRIRGSDIFAECNANANGLVLRSLHVLNLFGLEPEIDIAVKKLPPIVRPPESLAISVTMTLV